MENRSFRNYTVPDLVNKIKNGTKNINRKNISHAEVEKKDTEKFLTI